MASAPSGRRTPFLGVWQDPDAPQCRIAISRNENGGCGMEVSWDNGGGENSLWRLAGTYDEIWNGVAYLGTRHDERALEEGGVERVPVHGEATGLLYLQEGGSPPAKICLDWRKNLSPLVILSFIKQSLKSCTKKSWKLSHFKQRFSENIY